MLFTYPNFSLILTHFKGLWPWGGLDKRGCTVVGVDIMDLPKTESGNKHVVVFQDFLSKWPLVFPVPDQKALRLAQLLVQEVIPFFGVPEALLSNTFVKDV